MTFVDPAANNYTATSCSFTYPSSGGIYENCLSQ